MFGNGAVFRIQDNPFSELPANNIPRMIQGEGTNNLVLMPRMLI